jgi:hypothetical protein
MNKRSLLRLTTEFEYELLTDLCMGYGYTPITDVSTKLSEQDIVFISIPNRTYPTLSARNESHPWLILIHSDINFQAPMEYNETSRYMIVSQNMTYLTEVFRKLGSKKWNENLPIITKSIAVLLAEEGIQLRKVYQKRIDAMRRITPEQLLVRCR